MYENNYNLNQNPFQISTDPKFLWLGEKHKEALATLLYGVRDNKNFLLLTGDVGTGKTTLINALLKSQDKCTCVAIVQDPRLAPLDFLNYIAYAFGISERFASKGEFLVRFEEFLKKKYYSGEKVLLVIDESQRLQHDTLEEIRCLSNIEIVGSKLINIFFVGQDEFNDILARDENKAIRQRITVGYNIKPLTADEVCSYVEYRLSVAGGEKNIFAKDALRKIHMYTNGYPRMINILCDRCLLTGFVKGVKTITSKIVVECGDELGFLSSVKDGAKNTKKPCGLVVEGKANRMRVWGVLLLLMLAAIVAAFFVFVRHGEQITAGEVVQTRPENVSASSGVGLLPAPERIKPEQARSEEYPPPTASLAPTHEEMQILFSSNSITPSPQDMEALKKFADDFLLIRGAHLVIRGYADADGPVSYNKRLAEFRANAVKAFLAGRGVDMAKLISADVMVNPVGDAATSSPGGQSRRVELKIVFDDGFAESAKP